ncbi:acylphosphatase [Perlabentimonas gracilis]|uniref:acylphosphatase n=1 Tax=Perlabentimonas gracilis TaxID=2715279 RepID=UPI00140E9472|nr:acylphosphatase [Perlabentimonas gracilis]NHB67754.1 acylphosphatase [Perlabentimonas gracilis]
MDVKAKSIVLKGKVQQVGFRYFVFKLAAELDVKGFVKNQPDGSVYVEAEADAHTIEVFEAHCKMGSPHSNVTHFFVQPIPTQHFKEFTIR